MCQLQTFERLKTKPQLRKAGGGVARAYFRVHSVGEYQIGDVYARSWMDVGTSGASLTP
jgi:hypothetical protein